MLICEFYNAWQGLAQLYGISGGRCGARGNLSIFGFLGSRHRRLGIVPSPLYCPLPLVSY